MTAAVDIPITRFTRAGARETEGDAHDDVGRSSALSPLLAVCGTCGGAGTSTLSYLLARYAALHAGGHVLVCDTGGPSGGLAACAGLQSSRSLREVAALVAQGLPLLGRVYAVAEQAGTAGHELRVIATGPRIEEHDGNDGLEALLTMARSEGAHALTIVDCGTLQSEADRLVLRSASHVAWVLPATTAGVAPRRTRPRRPRPRNHGQRADRRARASGANGPSP